MDEAGSLSGLEGQDWAKWMRRMGRDRPEGESRTRARGRAAAGRGPGGVGRRPDRRTGLTCQGMESSPRCVLTLLLLLFADDLNGVDSPDEDASKPTAHCKRLPLKGKPPDGPWPSSAHCCLIPDHHLFGHCPEVDPFVAAVCEYCQKIVKIPFLQQHIAKAHNGMLKRYKIKEEPKPEVSVKQPSPPVVPKAPKVLPVMGKQSILVAAAARFAEAPLSPPSQPEVPAVVVKTEKSRKRGRSNKAEAPEKRRRVETAAGYNPDIHCGVWNEQTKTNCLRALTCRIHSLVLKRAVPMRTRLFDDLLAQHKAQHKLKKEASSSQVEEDGDVVIEEEEEEAAGRPNGRTINGSFANAEISLEDYPIANHEFLELPFPKLWASPSSEVLRRPILGDFQMPHKLQPPERWAIEDALDCRPPAPKPLMVYIHF
ncbi:Hypothetical predicted protein [Cloeon dipterum]|uniref:SCA7 domain-containing protein n=1 Tax=Cloeon dipterum TaxID=197152 RepID=A0A8S1DIR3_9INSE|nr:Hypothetical predicted protein [Cloeon dipterum]